MGSEAGPATPLLAQQWHTLLQADELAPKLVPPLKESYLAGWQASGGGGFVLSNPEPRTLNRQKGGPAAG